MATKERYIVRFLAPVKYPVSFLLPGDIRHRRKIRKKTMLKKMLLCDKLKYRKYNWALREGAFTPFNDCSGNFFCSGEWGE
jgi:hypothetical protein